MLIFLEKVRRKTTFSTFEPITTEPLELMYIKSVLDGLEIKSEIIDPMFGLEPSKNNVPDLVILTGYNVAHNEMLKRAAWYKSRDILVMVSGVHVQLNREEFRKDFVDYIFHSQDLRIFRNLVPEILKGEIKVSHSGVDMNKGNGEWILGNDSTVPYPEILAPSREFFYNNREKLRYLDKRDLALVKGGRGCPYDCSYCYCKNLNDGKYVKADFRNMFTEIKKIGAENIWVVDDVLLTDEESALRFVEASREVGFNKGIIAYLRADFVVRHGHLLKNLYSAGLHEVIIGFETPDENELLDYNKEMSKGTYPRAIKLLKENNISLTALFMVAPDYGIGEFRRLSRFIAVNRIEIYTISIFTPLQGSEGFSQYKDMLLTNRPEKFDFLHLVLPSRLPKPLFYTLFYLSHWRLLFSKRVWKYILAR